VTWSKQAIVSERQPVAREAIFSIRGTSFEFFSLRAFRRTVYSPPYPNRNKRSVA
jgi:hypothetical protein